VGAGTSKLLNRHIQLAQARSRAGDTLSDAGSGLGNDFPDDGSWWSKVSWCFLCVGDAEASDNQTNRIPPGLFQGPRIINKKLAGQLHPITKVPFDKQGFPDFSKFSIKTVEINQTGNRAVDALLANRAAGLESTPRGFIWHHHQNGTSMQLVNERIHGLTGHTGGVGLTK
jgi:hypothetical protein